MSLLLTPRDRVFALCEFDICFSVCVCACVHTHLERCFLGATLRLTSDSDFPEGRGLLTTVKSNQGWELPHYKCPVYLFS